MYLLPFFHLDLASIAKIQIRKIRQTNGARMVIL